MQVFIAEYHTFDKGSHSQQVTEVFLSYDAYALWLTKQLRYPSYQHIEGKGKDLRLVSKYSDDDDFTFLQLLVMTVHS